MGALSASRLERTKKYLPDLCKQAGHKKHGVLFSQLLIGRSRAQPDAWSVRVPGRAATLLRSFPPYAQK